MRLLICASLLLAACSAGGDDVDTRPLIKQVGNLETKKLDETSGLARSNRLGDVFWAMNDDGPAVIYALNTSGKHLGRVRIAGAKNRDWEDIASFVLDDTAYLVVADIGDNGSKYKHLSLYVVEEPDPKDDEVELAWRIDFQYPDGPRDAEAMAVDAVDGHIYVLAKRTVPAELYRLPLQTTSDDIVQADLVARLDSLPQPNKSDLKLAMKNGWGWQPTAMDFAPDGKSALVLTYDGVNYFSRSQGESWPDALQGRAMHLSLGMYEDAESIAYSDDAGVAFVTREGKHASLLRIELKLD
ncbi:MAG: hypothetical protein ACR2QL_13295 [Woeseiaceae bacterium]